MLIIEPDATMAQRMVAALGGHPCSERSPDRRAGDRACQGGGSRDICCVVLESLSELYQFDLARAELVICGAELSDGTGLFALDYLQGRAPHLSVIMVGAPDDAAVAVEAIQAGAMDFLTTTGHDLPTLGLVVEKCLAQQQVRQENDRLQRDLRSSLTELAVKNRQLQALVRQLEAMARTDDLTGLYNRRSLNEMLRNAWINSSGENRLLAFMMIDLDDFKAVNDHLGHQRGDESLRRIGRIIQANCRQVDVAARYGGDEFCVFMPECEAHEAILVARRILHATERAEASRLADEPRLSMSIGVAHVELSAPAGPELLIRHADEAMYAAKATGKHRVMVRDGDGVRNVETRARTALIER